VSSGYRPTSAPADLLRQSRSFLTRLLICCRRSQFRRAHTPSLSGAQILDRPGKGAERYGSLVALHRVLWSGLTRYLQRAGVRVIEVDSPNREERRRADKSDPLDAVEAAQSALSGRASGSPKSRDGAVEAILVLVVAKRSARQARVKALVQMRHLGQ
jgi:hypothetical protein